MYMSENFSFILCALKKESQYLDLKKDISVSRFLRYECVE